MREKTLEIFKAALRAVDPFHAVKRRMRLGSGQLTVDSGTYDLRGFERVLVVGAGKAAARMARAVEEVLDGAVTGGIVIVKYGHTAGLKIIEEAEAAHPVPDRAGLEATARIIDLLKGADKKTLVVCLLSGGASSLLTAPRGITLEEMTALTKKLLSAGADIFELNTVRKHCSSVKGGRLAELAAPAALLTLILSDVIGDRLDVIASGPTVPDPTTFRDAAAIIKKYSLEEKLPPGVTRLLERGLKGDVPETPKGGEPSFRNSRNIIVAGLRDALRAAHEKALELGLDARITSDNLHGEAREAALRLARAALEIGKNLPAGAKPVCLISGGETTVTVRGRGRGGRNQELALAFAVAIDGARGITFLSSATDGTDGETDAAGAVVDGATAGEARGAGLDPPDYLARNDSYTFFERLDALTGKTRHLKTGPTGTNVMDIQITVVEPRGRNAVPD